MRASAARSCHYSYPDLFDRHAHTLARNQKKLVPIVEPLTALGSRGKRQRYLSWRLFNAGIGKTLAVAETTAAVLVELIGWMMPDEYGGSRSEVKLDHNREQWFALSYEDIARATKLSRWEVKRALARLRRRGLIVSRCTFQNGTRTEPPEHILLLKVLPGMVGRLLHQVPDGEPENTKKFNENAEGAIGVAGSTTKTQAKRPSADTTKNLRVRKRPLYLLDLKTRAILKKKISCAKKISHKAATLSLIKDELGIYLGPPVCHRSQPAMPLPPTPGKHAQPPDHRSQRPEPYTMVRFGTSGSEQVECNPLLQEQPLPVESSEQDRRTTEASARGGREGTSTQHRGEAAHPSPRPRQKPSVSLPLEPKADRTVQPASLPLASGSSAYNGLVRVRVPEVCPRIQERFRPAAGPKPHPLRERSLDNFVWRFVWEFLKSRCSDPRKDAPRCKLVLYGFLECRPGFQLDRDLLIAMDVFTRYDPFWRPRITTLKGFLANFDTIEKQTLADQAKRREEAIAAEKRREEIQAQRQRAATATSGAGFERLFQRPPRRVVKPLRPAVKDEETALAEMRARLKKAGCTTFLAHLEEASHEPS